VIEAPKPSMVWYFVPGSTVMVVCALCPLPKATGARSCSSSALSGVVTQTRALTLFAVGSTAWAPADRPLSSSAATTAPIAGLFIVLLRSTPM